MSSSDMEKPSANDGNEGDDYDVPTPKMDVDDQGQDPLISVVSGQL